MFDDGLVEGITEGGASGIVDRMYDGIPDGLNDWLDSVGRFGCRLGFEFGLVEGCEKIFMK